MPHFYETTLFEQFVDPYERRVGLMGWQLLASPAEIDGHHVAYESLVDDLEQDRSQPLGGDLLDALRFVSDPQGRWWHGSPIRNARRRRSERREDGGRETPQELSRRLVDEPVFAAELSPLGARSVGELAALATTSLLVSLGDVPTVVLVGEAIGLVVIRPLTAVGGALWDGARDEVKDFGADSAAALLDALRRRLGVPRRESRGEEVDQ